MIPETASLLGTVRTISEAPRERVLDGVRRVAEGIATAHGAEAGVEVIRGYPVTVNDADFAGFVLDTARELLGPERVHALSHPIMGSEDFFYVLQRVPGTMANLGTRPRERPRLPESLQPDARQRGRPYHGHRHARRGGPALPETPDEGIAGRAIRLEFWTFPNRRSPATVMSWLSPSTQRNSRCGVVVVAGLVLVSLKSVRPKAPRQKINPLTTLPSCPRRATS